jgi:hypothetical protein
MILSALDCLTNGNETDQRSPKETRSNSTRAFTYANTHCTRVSYKFVTLTRPWTNSLTFRRVRILSKSAYEFRHVRTSVHMYQRGSHWTGYREIWYWALLSKSVDKTENWLQSDNNIGTVHEDLSTLYCCRRHKLVTVWQQYRHCTWRPKYVILLSAT